MMIDIRLVLQVLADSIEDEGLRHRVEESLVSEYIHAKKTDLQNRVESLEKLVNMQGHWSMDLYSQ